MNTYTTEMVVEEVEPDRERLLEDLVDAEVPSFLKSLAPFQDAWCAGGWLRAKLVANDCPEERVRRIVFEHGQRSFHDNPYTCAATMFNAFVEGTLQERPGDELALELIGHHIERQGDALVLKVGSPEVKARLEELIDRLKGLSPEEVEAEKERMAREFGFKIP